MTKWVRIKKELAEGSRSARTYIFLEFQFQRRDAFHTIFQGIRARLCFYRCLVGTFFICCYTDKYRLFPHAVFGIYFSAWLLGRVFYLLSSLTTTYVHTHRQTLATKRLTHYISVHRHLLVERIGYENNTTPGAGVYME